MDPEADSERPGPLTEYRRKRSGDRTAEPLGAHVDGAPDAAEVDLEGAAGVGKPRLFVCQMHAARRLHWDVRLEIDGVLRSWAVPRGPSFDPSVKRLAVETEDHPIEYVDFEGIIPEGNYGAGAMIVWDRGVWVPLEPVREGYTKGKLLFELRGSKLGGVWTLVRTRGTGGSKAAQGKEWLLIKKPDGAAGKPPPEDASVLSGLTIEELRSGSDRAKTIRDALLALGDAVPRRTVDASTLELMHAETRTEAFTREGWIFELKYDGYRLLASRPGGKARLRYRSGRDATAAFPEIARAIAALPFEGVVLDGEVCVLDSDARPNFQRLQKRAMLLRGRDIERAMREHPVTYYVFDLLAFEDLDLRGLPVQTRKALLADVLPSAGAVRYADHIETQGEALFEQVKALGVEGIVGKKLGSTYQGRRSMDWVRVRTEHTDDFVVLGFTRPDGSRTGLGALHVGAFIDGELTSVGRVGTGFRTSDLQELRAALDALTTDAPPVPLALAGRSDVYVEPRMVVEVRYKHRTDDGLLRHPVFLRRRDDKPASECILSGESSFAGEPEQGSEPDSVPAPELEAEPDAAPAPAPEATPVPDPTVMRPTPSAAGRRDVVISNPDKLFWPDDGYTKLDLIEYYRAIGPWLLPYLRDRALVLTRYPDGIDGKNFFQKNAPPFIPDWIRTKTMWSEHAGREIEYFVCNEVDSLVYVANLATIPLHVWGSRLSDLQHPDWCIIDLDPKTAPFEHVVQIALRVHALCDDIGLPNYVKTSGSTGLHILVPLAGQCTFEQCRMLAEIISRIIASELPEIATVERVMKARRGRVYLDFGQNGHGRLLVAPFSVRPRTRAPVSMPLTWDEVGEGLSADKFTIADAVARMEQFGTDPFMGVLGAAPDLQAILADLAARIPG